MAIRTIRTNDDEIFRKRAKHVNKIDLRLLSLLDDMVETMYQAEGVGLAAPQVGILKRMVVIDVGDGIIELINPEIQFTEGEENEVEGCLSLPGKTGNVIRPSKVNIKAVDRNGNEFEITGNGVLARAFCHEIDHLNGVLFTDKIVPDHMEEEG